VAHVRFSDSVLRHNPLSRNPYSESGLPPSKGSVLKVFAKLFELGTDSSAWMDRLGKIRTWFCLKRAAESEPRTPEAPAPPLIQSGVSLWPNHPPPTSQIFRRHDE